MTRRSSAALTLGLSSLLAVSVALAQGTMQDDSEALRRMDAYRADLIATLPEADQAIARRVVFRAPLAGGLGQVGAWVAADGTPIVSVNQGTHYAMQQLGQALVLALYVLKDDRFLHGYIRYLAYWDLFGGRPKTAVQFAQHYGSSDALARLDALSDSQRASGQGAEAMIMLFIVAHELAHHIHGDVNQGAPLAAGQRAQEARADAWAAQRMIALGYGPEMVVTCMLVIDQIERASPGNDDMRRHPKAMRRAQDLMRAVLDSLVTNPQAIRAALARIPASPSFDTYARALSQINKLVQAQADEQQRLDVDAKALLDSAKKGNIRSQHRLAGLFLTGEMDGLPRNKKTARFWSEKAASNDTPYEFFDSAYASYVAGVLVGKDGDDMKSACFYINRAASMSLSLGAYQLEQFKKHGFCGG